MKKGRFYAVGTGPGESGYLTLKAKRVIEKADIIAIPVRSAEESSTAFSIIKNEVDTENKEVIKLVFSMNSDINVRKQERIAAAQTVTAALEKGKNAVMITLGDVSVYSTGTYIIQSVRECGFDTEIVAGVPSFCAAAAAAGVSLCEGNETLAVVPSADMHEKIGLVFDMFDNVVIMKAGRNINKLSEFLIEKGLYDQTVVISNVGLDGEYIGPLSETQQYGYFTTLIVKKQKQE